MRCIYGVLLATLIALPAAAQNVQNFSINIDIAQSQASGNCLIGSTALGSGTAQLDLVNNQLSWSMTFGNNSPLFNNGLLDQGGELFSHFHDAPPGVNGPVEVTLNNGSPKVGSQVLSASQVTAALAGDFYANIHSAGCGAGEIRGQMVLVPIAIPALSETGLVVLVLLLLITMAVASWRKSAIST